MMLALLAALPWIGAAVVAVFPDHRRTAVAWAAGVVALAALAIVLAVAPAVFDGEVQRFAIDWLPALGLEFGLRMDGLAWLFALLITGIGSLVVLYAAWYMDPDDPAPRFFSFLLLFMGAMVGIVLADNLILLVVCWELTSLSSFLLIGYWTHRDDAREGARMALTITGAGGLCLLAGVLLIGHIVGSTRLDDVLAAGDVIRAHPMYETALILVLLGAFTKSAQFPFHFWLPHAMAAPTPVSAYLHSATMVKAGVFLLARMYPALGGSEPWFWIVSSVGLATLLLGAYTAIFQHDLKGLLAYSTISHLGLITLLLGLDKPLAVVAGVFHIINHATFKASLFMSAGIIDHECGSRDMRRVHGLFKVMPITAMLGITAAASMAGVPLLNGFLSKEMFFAEAVAVDRPGVIAWLLPLGATLAGLLSVAYSARFVHDVFFGGPVPRDLPQQPHEPPFFLRLPVLLLVVVCLAVGLLPAIVAGPTLAVAAQAALYETPLPYYTLAIWHGINPALVMSAIAVVGGIALYAGLKRFIDLHAIVKLPGWIAAGGRDIFVATQSFSLYVAGAVTGSLETGRLQRYLSLLVAVAIAAGAWPFIADGPATSMAIESIEATTIGVAVVAAIGILATFAVAFTFRNRMLAVVLIGAVGLTVSLTFVWFSAPDLALTQLLVELATTVLLMLSLRWLPSRSPPEVAKLRTAIHLVLAIASGVGIALLAWLMMSRPPASISDFFLAQSLPLGGGSNVVNVIIVDFRGFDTLGEITVLAIAAISIHALLAGFDPTLPPAGGHEHDKHPLLLQLVARLLLPFGVLISIYLLLRGHNQPGGGFIAGLVLAIAMLLLQVAHGHDWMAARTGREFRGWVGLGLAVAVATGAASALFGSPFLTSTYAHPTLPWIGEVPLASAALFDLGVYGVVVGGTMVMLLAIARLSRYMGGTR